MKHYATLDDVLDDLDNLIWQGTLFTDLRAWDAAPRQAAFLYLEGDDELEDIVDNETLLPRLAMEHGVRRFLDVEMFRDVIITQRKLDRDSGIAEFIRALNHYREYDAFYWPRH